jgi:hypothetical protein
MTALKSKYKACDEQGLLTGALILGVVFFGGIVSLICS